MSIRLQVILSILVILLAAVILLLLLPEESAAAEPKAFSEVLPSPQDGDRTKPSAQLKEDNSPDIPEAPEHSPEVTETPLSGEETQETASAVQSLLEEAGYDESWISGDQLIVVDTYGVEADLYRFERLDGVWTDIGEPLHAWIGSGGLSWEKQEGDGTTPGGLYRLGYGFGNEYPEEVYIDYRMVTEESFWVDDPDSAFYNTWVEGTEEQDWVSAEQLSAYPEEYAFAVVVEYNTDEPVYAAGSAIFLHCGWSPTAGCVAVEREAMLEILIWLQPDSGAEILIY